jgi:hypothetical protein
VGVPDFTWRRFNTGVEIPHDYWRWITGEPKQVFDENYGTYVGCGATTADNDMKTFNCRTPLNYICEVMYEDGHI